ncbi:hypothetical protein BH09BAC4_BH09BAC4_15840 [soil metagenome]
MSNRVVLRWSLTLFVLLTTYSVNVAQTTYYVASTGNDSNDGRSTARPLQSLDKVNSLSLQPGDAVLFRRGDTFRGTLKIRQSGSPSQAIVYDAYGNGPKPTLAGSVAVTAWSNMGGNIWQATCSACGSSVTGLYDREVSLPLGRYPNPDAPNKGTLTIQSHTEKNQLVSQDHLSRNWQGAEVVMVPTAWIIDRAIVSEQNGDVLNLLNPSTYYLKDGSPFFFQNHPATLDRNGEWSYEPATKRFQLYDDTGNLTRQTLTATVLDRAVDMANVSNIKLANLNLSQTLHTSLYATNVSNVSMSKLDITDAGEDGIMIDGFGRNVSLANSTLLDINNNAIQITGYDSVSLRSNAIRHIGAVAGRGKSGDGTYNGLQLRSNSNVLVANNVIDSIGYTGVTFGSQATIRQNVISNYCISKVDGGGIYGWNGDRSAMSDVHILSNIIYASPNVRGKYFTEDYSIGIFLDDCVENVAIQNNTIFGNTQWGAFLHGATGITFTDNTVFDNYAAQLVVYHNGGACPIRNDVIKRNVFVSKWVSQLAGQYESNADDLLQYGVIDSNYYARPFNDTNLIWGTINTYQAGAYSLTGWQRFSGQDLHSHSSPITYQPYKNEGAGGTTRFASSFDTGSDGWSILYSRYNNGVVTQDNSSQLDGGALRIGFTSPSGQTNSYMQAGRYVGNLRVGKAYVLRFDAVASGAVSALVYLRQNGPPFQEYDRRYTVQLSPTRTSYELPFTVSGSGLDAVVLVQLDGEGPTCWLDNVRFQEDVPIQNNPDDFIKLFYNPTLKDSLVALSGAYRDVKNQVYTQSFVLRPFTSVVLFKDTLPVSQADLSLSLQAAKRIVQVNESLAIRLRVSNQSNTQAALARWTYRLPANLQFIDTNGQVYSDNVMTGTVHQLPPLADTTFTLLVRPTAAGLFRTAAQLTTATSPDPDSTPNSGTADGEDDVASVDFRVSGPATAVFESPNPNQRLLPAVVSNQPTPVSNQADLSLRMDVNNRVPAVGEIITFTVYVSNAGGQTADIVHLENQLPNGFELVKATGWTANGRLLTITLTNIAANTTVSLPIQARLTTPGHWINQAQVSETTIDDPDSIPGNGFANGEDDEAQVDIRSK